MAQGSVVYVIPTSIASAASMTIQPSAGVEWLVKNIYYAGAVSFYKTDGSNPILFDSDGTAGAKQGCSFLVTNTCYITVKNVTTTPFYMCWDGLQTL